MFQGRLFRRNILIGLAMAATLAVAGSLAALAQDPHDRDAGAPAADKITPVEEVELLPDPAATDQITYFKFLSANTFVPYDDDMTYNYYDAGCMYRTGGAYWTEHSLELPQGAVIDFVRLFFYDNDAEHDAQAYVAAYDGTGNTTAVATVSSVGVPGQSSVGISVPAYTVDNVAAALSVSLNYGGATTSSLRICGVRIRYQHTLSIVDLPLILNGSTP